MGVNPLFSYSTLFGFLFTLARISGVFAFLPLAAFKAAPEATRIVLSLAMTLMLRNEWKAPPGTEAGAGFTMGRMVAGIASEAGLGLAIGVALAIVFEVFQMAAQAVSLQAGLGYASTIDPTTSADSTVLLTAAQLTAALLFFVSGADRLLVKALAESLRLAPPESFTLNKAWAEALIRFAATIFSSGLRLAAPLIALLLLADASLAILGRVQQQLHLISLTMPLKLGATMLILSATVVLQPGFFESLMTSWARLVEGILRTAH
jgi:flagellar biosynthetic protein FliR